MPSLLIQRVDGRRAVALAMALSALLSGAYACSSDPAASPTPTPQAPFEAGAEASAVDAAPLDAAVTDGPVVTWNEVYPIFSSSCAPCHVGTGTDPKSGSGGHSLASADKATAYQASQQPSYYCFGMKVGQCALVRIKDGSMPQSGDCSSNPKGPKCPSLADQALIQQWIDTGLREN